MTYKQENGIEGLMEHMRGVGWSPCVGLWWSPVRSWPHPCLPSPHPQDGGNGNQSVVESRPLAPRRPQACQAGAGARGHHFGHTASVPRCLSCGWPPSPSSSLLSAPPLLRMPPPPPALTWARIWASLLVVASSLPSPSPFGGSGDHLPVHLASLLAQAPL